jgi:dTDP-4-dehydrorhamnose reductase
MRILILGAKGMLGQALTDEFKQAGHEVLAWAREDLDVSDAALVASRITSNIDVLIDAAGYNDIDKAEEEQDAAMKVNAYPVGTLADICNMLGMVFVTFSSEHVFSGKDNKGYTEKSSVDPLSSFGRSKRLAEKFAIEDNDQTYLIRTSRLFGTQGSSANAKQSFIEKIKTQARERGSLQSVHDEVASPTYVVDLAKRVRELVEQKEPFGIYHLTNAGYATWFQLASKIVELSKITAPVTAVSRKEMPSVAPRPRYGMLVNTKTPAMRSWEEALAEFLK